MFFSDYFKPISTNLARTIFNSPAKYREIPLKYGIVLACNAIQGLKRILI